MPLNKTIYFKTDSFVDQVASFGTTPVVMDGITTSSFQVNIDVTNPNAKTFTAGEYAELVDQGITYTAVDQGSAGNSITIEYIDPGTPSASETVNVVGTDITLSLGTDAGVKASRVIQDLTYQAKSVGVAGNSTTITLADPGVPSSVLSIGVVGTAITVNLATDAGIKASRVIQDLTFEAQAIGTAGNSITMTFVDPGAPSSALSVGLAGTDITVNLATDGASALISTAADIKAALDLDAPILALISTVISGTGSNVQVAQTILSLQNGAAQALISTATAIAAAIAISGPANALIDVIVSGTGSNVQTAQTVLALELGANPAITTTASSIVAALSVIPAVAALVGLAGAGGVVTALAQTPLAGGVDANIDVALDEYTIAGHGLTTGEVGQLTSTGTLPTGLSLATNYYVIVVDANTIKLASSYANALLGTAVNITNAGTAGATTTLTLTSTSATVKVQKSNDPDSGYWFDDSSAEAFTADGAFGFERNPPGMRYYRLYFTLTAGRFSVDVITCLKGPN